MYNRSNKDVQVTEETTPKQSFPNYISYRIESSLSLLNRVLWTIPISLLGIYLFSLTFSIIGAYAKLESLEVLTIIIAMIAPIAVLFYYFFRLLIYLRKNKLNIIRQDTTDLHAPIPYNGEELRISTKTIRAIFQGYTGGIVGILWIKAVKFLQDGSGTNYMKRLEYIYNHVSWLNDSTSTILVLLFPSSVTEMGQEMLAILGILFFSFLTISSIIWISEELVSAFRTDSKERIFGIVVAHYYLLTSVSRQGWLIAKVFLALGINLYLYQYILWFAYLEVCWDVNQQGFSWIKCFGI